jgi:hypothetical protein
VHFVVLAVVAIVTFALAMLALRQFVLSYGLTDREIIDEWPGDRAVPGAKPSGTRAISIAASAQSVWPWIAQIGRDRAGFYSYRWLENLFGAKMPDVKVIVPTWTHREVGQQLVMAPVERWGRIAAMDLVEVVQDRHLVYTNWEGAWSFILVPVSDVECRFVCRGTWVPSKNPIVRLLRSVLFDPIHFLMEWKMMRTIKRLAESAGVR